MSRCELSFEDLDAVSGGVSIGLVDVARQAAAQTGVLVGQSPATFGLPSPSTLGVPFGVGYGSLPFGDLQGLPFAPANLGQVSGLVAATPQPAALAPAVAPFPFMQNLLPALTPIFAQGGVAAAPVPAPGSLSDPTLAASGARTDEVIDPVDNPGVSERSLSGQ